jgi:DNA-binding CsgD family transcriptional regulator
MRETNNSKMRQLALAPIGHPTNKVTFEVPSVEIVEGVEEVWNTFQDLNNQAQIKVDSMITGRAPTLDQVRRHKALNEVMYYQNIKSRTIYESNVRDNQVLLDYVLWLNERGSEVRTVLRLPIQLILVDDNVAVLHLFPSGGKPGIVIYRGGSVVLALQSLFNLVWQSASPLGAVLANDGNPISFEDRTLIELLSLGRIDKEISEALEVSDRTVERRVSKLMGRLNAKTRFAAGVKAAKAHWV